jgi:erythromycin esterase
MCSNVTDTIREYTTPLDGLGRTADGRDDHRAQSSASRPAESLIELFGASGSTPDGGTIVAGLGEATHGTRECFTLKAGLIRFLVEQCGVRTVALEADVTATRALDACVRRGEPALAAALDGLHKWMWRVESIRDLLVWLRSFNRDRPPGDQVRVRGVDLGHPAAPAGPLQSSVEAVDPTYAATSDPLARLATLAEDDVPENDRAREAWLDEAAQLATEIERDIDERAGADSSAAQHLERARHLCRVVRRTCDWHRVRHEQPGPHAAGMQRRDRHMARNVAWCVEQDPGYGVAVWAHNIHVERGTFDDGRPWTDATGMGEFLARAFGERYTPVGFDVGRGRFRAVAADGGNGGPREFSLGAPGAGSATATFESVGGAPWLLDVQSAATDPRLRDLLDQPRRVRCVGTVYDPEMPDDHLLRTPLTSFDALVFAERSTPSRPVEPTATGE